MGARIDIQPSGNPSLVVSLTHLRPDPNLTVGSTRRRDHLEGRDDHRLRPRRAPGPRARDHGRGEPRGDRGPRRHAVAALRILFIADVFGTAGRKAVEERLPGLKEEHGVGFCVVNGENVADGAGITPRLADRLLAAGADVITLGNHVWRRREIAPYLETRRARRPAGEPRLEHAGPRAGRRRRRGRDAGGRAEPAGRALHGHAGQPVRGRGRAGRGGARRGEGRARRLPRRGDEREGRALARCSTAR